MSPVQLFNNLTSGDRMALAKAITIIESEKLEHQILAEELIGLAIKHKKTSWRIGITGAPGVGKSTFINHFGSWLIKQHNKEICVLAIDPSSKKNHGSILGDKTRMDQISSMENVFIRPSPSSGNLGGVARKSRETILICEAAGFDITLIETVGVGQSEVMVDSIVDCIILLLLPNSGDDLQGIKRGIMETADLIILNKTDSTDKAVVHQSMMDVSNAIHFLPNKFEGWEAPVLKNGLDNITDKVTVWEQIQRFFNQQLLNGNLELKRNEQKKEWLLEALTQKLIKTTIQHPAAEAIIQKSINDLYLGNTSVSKIIEELMTVRQALV